MNQNQLKTPNPVLRKSASLIILYPQPANEVEKVIYKTLVLKRKSSMSFSSMYVFPGGTTDKNDQISIKYQQFQQYSKITALREFLQQSGLLLYPTQLKGEIQKLQFIKNQQEEIGHKLGQIWKSHLGLIQPVLRLMTPNIEKGKRFDCLFHLCRVNQNLSIINLRYLKELLKAPNSPQKFQELVLNSSKLTKTPLIFNKFESDAKIIDTPCRILQLYSANKINLAPPQIIILKCLSNLCLDKNKQQLIKFSISKQKTYFVNIEPIIFQFDLESRRFYIFGDKNYDAKKILIKQPQSQSKLDLQKFFSSEIKNGAIKQNGCRFIQINQRVTLFSNYAQKDNKLLLKFLSNDQIFPTI